MLHLRNTHSSFRHRTPKYRSDCGSMTSRSTHKNRQAATATVTRTHLVATTSMTWREVNIKTKLEKGDSYLPVAPSL